MAEDEAGPPAAEYGIIFFPDARQSSRVAEIHGHDILKPHGSVKWRAFLMRRLWIGLFSIGFALVHVMLTFEYFYYYLTVWIIISNALFYALLLASHAMNGDFWREEYETPLVDLPHNDGKFGVFDRSRFPFNFWPVTHMLYEWCLCGNVVVVGAFWLIEAPAMIYQFGWSARTDLPTQLMLFVDHILPATLMLFEWYHCSIRVSNERIFLYALGGLFYAVVLVYLSLYYLSYGRSVYYSMDFNDQPLTSSLILSLIVLSLPLVLRTWTKVTRKRFGQ